MSKTEQFFENDTREYRFTLCEPNSLGGGPIVIQLLHEGHVVYTTQEYPFEAQYSEEWRGQYAKAKAELRGWLAIAYPGYTMPGL